MVRPSSRVSGRATGVVAARAERCEAEDALEDGAGFFGAEEAVLDREAGGAETETGFEEGEVGG